MSWLKVDKRKKKINCLRKDGAVVPEEAWAKLGGTVVLCSTGWSCQKAGKIFWAKKGHGQTVPKF